MRNFGPLCIEVQNIKQNTVTHSDVTDIIRTVNFHVVSGKRKFISHDTTTISGLLMAVK